METRSANFGPRTEEPFGPGFHHFNIPPESTSSFTALLELPPNQAVELLVHTPPSPPPPPPAPEVYGFSSFGCDVPPPIFPADMELVNRAAKFSVFATPEKSPDNTPESSDTKQVKQEVVDSSPAMSETTFYTPSNKRKDRGKKAKESNKRNKTPVDDGKNGNGDGGDEKLPYVHVRARRGQATDSHSLAERARREKINARMKLLQELVPGCHKISGTASVLDEIINHVQSLQRQVEFLSMRLAAVNPRIDINLDSLMSGDNGSLVESNYPGIPMPSVWPEEQIRPQYQHLWQLDGFQHSVWVKEEDNSNFVPP